MEGFIIYTRIRELQNSKKNSKFEAKKVVKNSKTLLTISNVCKNSKNNSKTLLRISKPLSILRTLRIKTE